MIEIGNFKKKPQLEELLKILSNGEYHFKELRFKASTRTFFLRNLNNSNIWLCTSSLHIEMSQSAIHLENLKQILNINVPKLKTFKLKILKPQPLNLDQDDLRKITSVRDVDLDGLLTEMHCYNRLLEEVATNENTTIRSLSLNLPSFNDNQLNLETSCWISGKPLGIQLDILRCTLYSHCCVPVFFCFYAVDAKVRKGMIKITLKYLPRI